MFSQEGLMNSEIFKLYLQDWNYDFFIIAANYSAPFLDIESKLIAVNHNCLVLAWVVYVSVTEGVQTLT